MYNCKSAVKNIVLKPFFSEKYEAEYLDRFANPFPAATRGTFSPEKQNVFMATTMLAVGLLSKFSWVGLVTEMVDIDPLIISKPAKMQRAFQNPAKR